MSCARKASNSGCRTSPSWFWQRCWSDPANSSPAIAYSKVSEQSNIWALPITAGGVLSLAGGAAISTGNQLIESVDVSPDGGWIVCDSDRAGNADIWMMRTDGSDLRQVTRHGAHDWSPSFSPDGTRVVFHSLRDGNRNLYVAPVAGGAVTRLTDDSAKDWLPKWSPDGELIVFASDRTGPLCQGSCRPTPYLCDLWGRERR